MFRRPADLRDADFPIKYRPLGNPEDVEPLLNLCERGKLYEVEAWLAQGRPVQFPHPEDRKIQRWQTALQIAVRKGFHSLAAALLANGYDPNADHFECLGPAVRAKDHEMVELLLRFGADPHSVDFCDVLETCDRQLMDRFIAVGVDPCHENAIARSLHFKGRPILGFIKQYKDQFPCIQRQIDIALHVFTEAEDLRGIALMLWVGADPHAHTPSSAYGEDNSKADDATTAFNTALYSRKPEVMDMLSKRPIPDSRVAELFHVVAYRHRPDLVRRLLKQGADPNSLSEDGSHVLNEFVYTLLSRFGRDRQETEQAFEALEVVLQAGAKWNLDDQKIKGLRRSLADGESRIVIRLLELLHNYGALSPDHLHELTRTAAVRRVLNGFSKQRGRHWGPAYSPPPIAAPPPPISRGHWKKHWAQHHSR